MSMMSMDYCLDNNLLNCFVNPNYNFNEDDYWKNEDGDIEIVDDVIDDGNGDGLDSII